MRGIVAVGFGLFVALILALNLLAWFTVRDATWRDTGQNPPPPVVWCCAPLP